MYDYIGIVLAYLRDLKSGISNSFRQKNIQNSARTAICSWAFTVATCASAAELWRLYI